MSKSLFLLFLFFSFLSAPILHAQEDITIAETVVHLLGYVAMDYPEAVENGDIINEQEYSEQQEFSQQAYDLTSENAFLEEEEKASLLPKIEELIDYIEDLRSAEEINRLATQINAQIIALTGLETAPKVWPSLNRGKELYAQTCAVCHGKNGYGDGPSGRGIDPAPSNFHDIQLMNNFSTYQAYNSIRLGVPGTAMTAYSSAYDETELWDLAFYVKSLRFEESDEDLASVFADLQDKISLVEVANRTDRELLDTLKTLTEDPELGLAALRLMEPTDKQKTNSLPIARNKLKAALKSYEEGDTKSSRKQAIDAYLEGVEPIEAQLRAQNSKLVVELENSMFDVRQGIDKDMGAEEVGTRVQAAIARIDEADDTLKGQKLNYWLTFIIAGSIFLREALEAFLILALVLTIIRKTGAKRAHPWLHGGWITAILAGVAGWFFSDYILQFGGKNREIMEGAISIFAVIVLVYMGFWLHDKSEARQWTKFIKEKVGSYLKTDRMVGLAFFSFVIVFREAFEVILFLQAVNLEAAPENKSAIGLGVLAAIAIVMVFAYLFFRFSKMISVRKIFLYSSWAILILAFILIGKGIHSLQESGWIGVTGLPGFPRLEELGIYPTLQTLVGQIGLILLMSIIFFIQKHKHSRESETESSSNTKVSTE